MKGVRQPNRSYEVALALAQTGHGASAREVARALEAQPSSIQRALVSLSRMGLVSTGSGRTTLALTHPASEAFLEFASRMLPPDRAMAVIARANPAVEFAGSDEQGSVLVLSPFRQPSDVVRLRSGIARVIDRRSGTPTVELIDRDVLRERLADDRALLARGHAMRVDKGSAARTYRDPREHGSFAATRLHRLNPDLPRIPGTLLANLAATHHLSFIKAFGSAVRDDLRPGSDVDVLIEPVHGHALSLDAYLDVQERLERVLQRDVDVVDARYVRPDVLARAREEEVVLHGRA